ncbi:branched-chain amino acid ABC transporter permease [Actinocrispum wychmicini]|uniref:Branched-chain amino acid transport system permease protein n=1 Tax=Actinocrispum wychmicini TaxID=1213861 RepID=A0A4R2J7E3_9PSEU|nr:branched-chain amino acid ABC transporter permease [Actinocrispum wychmicini]TCO54047.1 branched-chain amino acid transport system permease protein [Actinocrispum wychmicini]
MDAYFVPAVDGVAYGLLLFVVAAGLTLAFGTGGVLNLTHGMLYALGAYAAALLSDGTWTAMAIAVAAGCVAGCGGGALVAALTAPLARRGHLAQAVLTAGLALVCGDFMISLFGPNDLPVAIPAALDSTVDLAGHRYPAYRLVFIVVALAIAVVGRLVLTGTRQGALVRAAVDDPDMVAALGSNPRLIHFAVLTSAGGLAGLAGSLGAPILGPSPHTSDIVLLLSLVIVVLGGLGSIGGALLASVAVGEIQTLGVAVAPALAPYLLFLAMAGALVLRARRSPLGTSRAA